MSNFVLVHGAWQGAWSWQRVIEEIEAAREAHDVGKVLALDLPGHGLRRADEIRRITMEHYVQAVVTRIQVGRLEDVVLVGHGFAATFLPQVALELGEKVRRVVFIAGEVPPDGKPAYERLSPRDKLMLRAFKAAEKGFRFPDFIFKKILCNGLDYSSTRVMLSQLVTEPFLPWQTPVFREGFVGQFPVSYVIATRDKAVPPGLQRRSIQFLGSPNVEELDAGHGALLSHPRDVANSILKHA